MTFSGMYTLVSPAKQKAYAPNLSMSFLGNRISVSDVQLENAYVAISDSEAGSFTSVSFSQPANAYAHIFLTPSGIVIDLIAVSEKA